jgi:hypothetical protein
MSVSPLARLPVGVIVERRKAASAWIDFTWRAVGILPGHPAAAPWTELSSGGDVSTFYAGAATIDLYRSETPHYEYNLKTGRPSIWIKLRRTGRAMPYDVAAVTVDPTEGESYSEAGDDLVDAVPMPEVIRTALEAFVAEHHVEQVFYKRKRTRADPEALSRQAPIRQDRDHE